VATDVGLHRSANEDSFVAACPVFAVADGMGGHSAGDIASGAVVSRLAELQSDGFAHTDDVQPALERAVTDLGAQVTDAQRSAGTTVTGAALVLAELGWPGLDPIFGLLIAAGVVKSAWGIGNNAVRALMDHELPAETQAEIQRLALSMAGVLGVHDLRTRQSGPTIVIQLHLELDDSQSLMDAHHTTEAVEAALRQAHPGAEVFIHQDPVSVVKDDVLGRVRPPEPPTSLP
jgi:hypothetical protein